MFNTTTFQVASETTVMSHHFARLRIMYFFKYFNRDDRESWAHICETIAGMPNLHTLHMHLCHTSEFHHEHHKKQESGGSQQAPQNSSSNLAEPEPISEKFILNSLYQIEQVTEFKVELEPRWRSKGFILPTGHSNAPFRLICEYAEDVEARREKKEQEQRERLRIRQREQDEEYRREMELKNADELEKKAQEMVQAYQSLSG